MKNKAISIVLALFVVLGTASVSALSSYDVNSDGKVNVLDVTAIQKYLVGLTDLTSEEIVNADINNDEIINICDVTALQYKLAYPNEAKEPEHTTDVWLPALRD